MKKLLFASLLLGAMVVASCNNETVAINTVESLKTTEMRNFDAAMKSLGKPENRPTEEERKTATTELSDRRKAILIPASRALIFSSGVTEAELSRKTNGDKSAIIVWAIKIYLDNNNKITKKIKYEN